MRMISCHLLERYRYTASDIPPPPRYPDILDITQMSLFYHHCSLCSIQRGQENHLQMHLH